MIAEGDTSFSNLSIFENVGDVTGFFQQKTEGSGIIHEIARFSHIIIPAVVTCWQIG
jgi:hypothetical protein